MYSPRFSKISINGARQQWRSRDHSQGSCGAADAETTRSARFRRPARTSITDLSAVAACFWAVAQARGHAAAAEAFHLRARHSLSHRSACLGRSPFPQQMCALRTVPGWFGGARLSSSHTFSGTYAKIVRTYAMYTKLAYTSAHPPNDVCRTDCPCHCDTACFNPLRERAGPHTASSVSQALSSPSSLPLRVTSSLPHLTQEQSHILSVSFLPSRRTFSLVLRSPSRDPPTETL
jgi:hypothetical protein